MRLSLRLKMMAGVLLPLSLALGAFAYSEYNVHREHELVTAARTATALGWAIQSSLMEAMLDQDLAAIQASIDNIAANPQVRDMTELQEKEVIRAQLLKQIISAQEAERKRIARELHDELAQSPTSLIMSLDSAEGVLGPELQNAHDQLARTREIAARALEQTRQLILDLRPTMLVLLW